MLSKLKSAFSAIALLSSVASAKAADAGLAGTYRLISSTRTVVSTGETKQNFGEDPTGYIMYGPDHRMMVLMVTKDRPKRDFKSVTDNDRVQLFDTMAAYYGRYTFDGTTVRHMIEASWNETLSGTTQVRQVRKEGDRLIYSTKASPSVIDGEISTSELIWERMPDAGAVYSSN